MQVEAESKKQDLLARLKTVRGHIKGIERMLEEDKDCTELLIQLAAIKSSVDKIGLSLLEENACQCIIEAVEKEEEVEAAIEESVEAILKFTDK